MVFELGNNKHINKHYATITNSKVLIALSQALIKISFCQCFASIISNF